MYTQYKVVYYEDIGKYFVHAKKPCGLLIKLSKPYKTKKARLYSYEYVVIRLRL